MTQTLTKGKPREDTERRQPIHKPRRESSPETSHANTLISGFHLPEMRDNAFLLFKPVDGILLWQPQQTDTVGKDHTMNWHFEKL